MKLQFSISELSSYLDEVFPQVVNRYRIVDLQQGYARVIQNITQENLRPGGTVPVQRFLVLLISECIFCFWRILARSLWP